MNLFLFNPENDLALAANRRYYTPPAKIVRLRKQMCMTPAVLAHQGDLILLMDKQDVSELSLLPFYQEVIDKQLTFIFPEDLPFYSSLISGVVPWGWSKYVKHFLSEAGIGKSLLPDDKYLEKLRDLSHRKTAIIFQNELQIILKDIEVPLAKELFTIEEVKDFLNQHNNVYLKAPWSSSGRGIENSEMLSEKLLLEWALGTIKRQGSVMAENGFKRSLDFATEWYCQDGKAEFLGHAFFNTTSEGRYKGNYFVSQERAYDVINQFCGSYTPEFVEAQKYVIDKIISPCYKGPLGIDMFVSQEGTVNPCVEINLRHTMGHVFISKEIKIYNGK